VPALKLALRKIAVERHRYFIEIHSGVILLGAHVVLLPGAAGRGKTTLTAALAASGGVYFSDEIALLEAGTLAVRPMPLTMTIKPGSVAPLRHLYPSLDSLDEHLREDRQPVRYLPPSPQARYGPGGAPRPVKWIVFPHYEAGGATTLTPLTRPTGLRRLLDESLVLPDALDPRAVRSLVEWARTLELYDLRVASLEAGTRAVLDLAATSSDSAAGSSSRLAGRSTPTGP